MSGSGQLERREGDQRCWLVGATRLATPLAGESCARDGPTRKNLLRIQADSASESLAWERNQCRGGRSG